jgi:hypothetical protein
MVRTVEATRRMERNGQATGTPLLEFRRVAAKICRLIKDLVASAVSADWVVC